MNLALNSQCMHDLGQKVNAGWSFCDPFAAGDVYSAGPNWHLRHPLQRALPADSVSLPSLAECRWERWEQVDGKNKQEGDSGEKSYHHLQMQSIGENTVRFHAFFNCGKKSVALQYSTTLLSLCREICLLARHLHKTFNTFNNKTSTTQWNTELKNAQIQGKYLTITMYTHTHRCTHKCTHPPTHIIL